MGGYPADLGGLDAAGRSSQIPGGRASRSGAKIPSYLETGPFPELEELRAQIPPGVREMMSIPGLGPKKAMVLYQELGIASVDELAAADRADERVAALKGFGAKTAGEHRARGAEQLPASGGRVLVSVALRPRRGAPGASSRPLPRGAPGGVRRVAAADGGDDRRRRPPGGGRRAPTDHGRVRRAADVVDRVIAHGDTKSSILTTADSRSTSAWSRPSRGAPR